MRNIKLTIQYEGSAYIGWQRQAVKHGLSVQQVIENALAEMTGAPVTLHGAGRTDKGVHALAQTAHFACIPSIPLENIPRALNHILPPDIRITEAEQVGEDFHSRYSASGKRYRYLLATDKPTAFNYRWYWPQQQLPDVEAMSRAAEYLLGGHDFRHFTLSNTTVKNFYRELNSLEIFVSKPRELPCYLAAPLAIEARANGFLYKMMRLIVARLVAVGQGRIPPASMADFLTGQPPLLIPPAPPQGLMLMQVYYEDKS